MNIKAFTLYLVIGAQLGGSVVYAVATARAFGRLEATVTQLDGAVTELRALHAVHARTP